MNKFFKDALGLIRDYKWNSIFFKYFKVLSLVFAIPAIIFIVITLNLHYSSVKSEINTEQRYNIIKSLIQFDNAFTNIDDIYNELLSNRLTAEYIKSGMSENSEYSAFLRDLERRFTYINSISVYNPKTDFVCSSYGSQYSEHFRDTSWLELFQDGYVEFSRPASPKGVENSKLVNIGKSLLINDRNAGLVIITLDGEILVQEMYTGDGGTNEAVFFFDAKNNLFYSSNPDILNANLENIQKTVADSSYRDESVTSTLSMHYNAIASENHDYKLAVALDLDAHNKSFSKIISVAVIYFVIILLLVILVSLVIAFMFYRSIVNVVTRTTSPNIAPPDESNDNELVYLSNTLFNTIKNHEKIEQELVDKIATLKKVQSIALQTQINPHFLFNTLNLVNGFILEESKGDSKAATMLSNLSDILYIALNTKDYIVTVETELEYAKKYIDIEKVKYPGKFHVNYDIDPDTLNCKTVKFVLQPIIENAIEHGMKKLEKNNGIITISTAIFNNRLVLSVSDNGPKIPKDRLEVLEKMLESDEIQETKHIGLSNVNQRIKLIFGKEYGVNIFSDDAETIIDIVMPDI